MPPTVPRTAHSTRRRSAAVAATALAAAVLASCSPGPGAYNPGECGRNRIARTDIVVLTDDGRLGCVEGAKPTATKVIGAVTGLAAGETLLSIDYRSPFTDSAGTSNGVGQEGVLYGLGNLGGIYSIDAKTAVATKKSQLSVALTGGRTSIDFNPTVDRLRVVGDDGQDLRVNVDTGAAIVDGTLNYASVTAPGINGIAYTNVDTDPATATTLYDIDTTVDQLVVQNPPNSGTLVQIGGALGVDATGPVGFDLYSKLADIGGGRYTTTDIEGYATVTTSGASTLYQVTPFSGRLTSIGAVPLPVRDLAIPLAQ